MSNLPAGFPPSSYAIDDFVHNRQDGLPHTVGLTLWRAFIIAPGLYLSGQRRGIARTALYVSGTITLGMIAMKIAEAVHEAPATSTPSPPSAGPT